MICTHLFEYNFPSRKFSSLIALHIFVTTTTTTKTQRRKEGKKNESEYARDYDICEARVYVQPIKIRLGHAHTKCQYPCR